MIGTDAFARQVGGDQAVVIFGPGFEPFEKLADRSGFVDHRRFEGDDGSVAGIGPVFELVFRGATVRVEFGIEPAAVGVQFVDEELADDRLSLGGEDLVQPSRDAAVRVFHREALMVGAAEFEPGDFSRHVVVV